MDLAFTDLAHVLGWDVGALGEQPGDTARPSKMSRSLSPSISCTFPTSLPSAAKHLPAGLDHEPRPRVGHQTTLPPTYQTGPCVADRLACRRARAGSRTSPGMPPLVEALEAAAHHLRRRAVAEAARARGSGSPASPPKREGLTGASASAAGSRWSLEVSSISRVEVAPVRRAAARPRRPTPRRAIRLRGRGRRRRGSPAPTSSSSRRIRSSSSRASARSTAAGDGPAPLAGGVEAQLAAGAARLQRRRERAAARGRFRSSAA